MTAALAAIHMAAAHGAPMERRDVIQVIADFGLEGDRGARQGRLGQVLLVPVEVLDRLDLLPGMVRENFTTRGLDVMALRPGQQLKVGVALLEVSKEAHPCEVMDRVRPGLRKQLEGQRGMLCKVIEGGMVAVGDDITLMER